jgi:hypothetical protein
MAKLPPQPKRDEAWIARFEQQKEDYLWCLEQPEILVQHAGRVVILHNRKIIGVGCDNLEALEEAQRECQEKQGTFPPHRELVFVSIPEAVELDPSFFSFALRAESQPT